MPSFLARSDHVDLVILTSPFLFFFTIRGWIRWWEVTPHVTDELREKVRPVKCLCCINFDGEWWSSSVSNTRVSFERSYPCDQLRLWGQDRVGQWGKMPKFSPLLFPFSLSWLLCKIIVFRGIDLRNMAKHLATGFAAGVSMILKFVLILGSRSNALKTVYLGLRVPFG